MFLDGLDELDQKILERLIKNARMSYSQIGKEIGISRVAVKMRVRALEKRGVIEEYTAIIDPDKISGALSYYFEIEVKPEALDKVIAILQASNTVTQVYRTTGSGHLHVHAVASSHKEMETLIQDTIDKLPGLENCRFYMIVSRIKDIKGLRL